MKQNSSAKAEGGTQKPDSSSSPSPLVGEGRGEGAAVKAEGRMQKAEMGAVKADDDVLTVRGRVLDREGKPVAGAEVMAVHYFWKTTHYSVPLTTVKSDEQGQFHLTFHKSQLDVTAPIRPTIQFPSSPGCPILISGWAGSTMGRGNLPQTSQL